MTKCLSLRLSEEQKVASKSENIFQIKMAAKNSKTTLKSLQIELNLLREELKLHKNELNDVKEELKNVKEEKETEKTPILKPEDVFNCKICDLSLRSKKELKMHNQSKHTQRIKCDECDETFGKNCDLESHIEQSHDSVNKFECDKCGKNFVLQWRLKKHQDIHTNQNIRKCHYNLTTLF